MGNETPVEIIPTSFNAVSVPQKSEVATYKIVSAPFDKPVMTFTEPAGDDEAISG